MNKSNVLCEIKIKHDEMFEQFQELIERFEDSEEGRSINKLLTCDPMVLNLLFKVNLYNVSHMYSLFLGLYHAFADDGDVYINRSISKAGEGIRQRSNEFWMTNGKEYMIDHKICYEYSINLHCHGEERSPLTLEDFVEVINAVQAPFTYYHDNEDKLDNNHPSSEKLTEHRMLCIKSKDKQEEVYNKSEITK